MRIDLLGALVCTGAVAVAAGCGDSDVPNLLGTTAGLATGGDAGMTGPMNDGGDDGLTNGLLDSSVTSGDGGDDAGDTGGPDDSCGAIKETADVERTPADIVIALDTSGSMDFEFCQVALNLSNFADGVGPQTRVTTIYEIGANFWDGFLDQFLGGVTGGCSDEDPFANSMLAGDPERYLHVQQEVDSHNALERLLSEYGSYSSFLRPDSPTHFIVVTDDTSSIPGDQFRTQMEANLGHPFYFHAIAYTGSNMGNSGCSGDTGQQYLDLATATGGEQLSICASDWSQLFAELEAAVEASSPLPCAFDIPEPPAGEVFSPNQVSVSYTPPGGNEQVFPKAQTADACGDQSGWHFDDEESPTQIEFCPAACDLVGDGGELGIAFGCEPPVLL